MRVKIDREFEESELVFDFAFYVKDETGEYGIEVYDSDNELVAMYVGKDFGAILRHAVYDVDPVLAAAAWTKDYLEFSENHKIEEGPEL
jgi:hypothetical protein